MMLIAAVCTLFAMIFIVIDTQMIIGEGKYGVTHDDYIVGSLVLYIDFINLFI
jgi:FtsH-binding integral membrane protein